MKKRTIFPTSKKVQLSIPSFEKGISLKYDKALTNFNYASSIENFSFDTGALTGGIGFDNIFSHISKPNEAQNLSTDLKNIGDIERIFYFYKYNSTLCQKEDKLVFVSASHQIYYVDLQKTNKQLSTLRNIKFTSTPDAIRYRLNGEDVLIFTSETDNMKVWDGTNAPYEVLDAPHISSMAVHFERLFATVDGEKNSIWFSDELDPTEWSVSLDEAGFIELIDERGTLNKVVSFNDYIYIFRDYGISRLSAFGNQTQFSASNLYVSSGKIYPKSVCVCGDKIIFLSSDGLYKFDGVDTVKILENIENGFKNMDNKNAISCFYGSSYFLACNFQNGTEYLDTLLEIDTDNYSLKSIVKGYDFKFISTIQSETVNGVIAVLKKTKENAFLVGFIVKNGSYFGKSTKKVWKSQTSNIGETFANKVLRSVFVQTDCPVLIKVFDGEKYHNFQFESSKKLCMKKCIIPLVDFSFEIECESTSCNIKNLKFEFFTLGREPKWTMEKVHI